MLDLNTPREYWIIAEPTDMRKRCDSLASIVRQKFGKDPKMGMRAFIFYAKNMKTIKILHYTVTGYEMYVKWLDDGRALRPEFSKMKMTHTMSIFLPTGYLKARFTLANKQISLNSRKIILQPMLNRLIISYAVG